MSNYKGAVVIGLLKDVTNQTNVQQLHNFESKNLRIRKALSEDDQSQTFDSFMRLMVTNNYSFMQDIVRTFSQYENCNIDFEFGDGKPTKVMVRKAGSTSAVASLVINFRTMMIDNSELRSERELCMISHDDTLLSHLACSSSGEIKMYIVPSKEPLPQFSSNFRSGQKLLSEVILMALDENDSICNIIIDPNFDQIQEFAKNDKEAVSGNTDKSTSSSKSAKRKSTGDSDRANKSAKKADTAKAPETTADTDESPVVEATKKSSKKSKTNKKSSSKKEGKRKTASTESESKSKKSNKAAKTAAPEETVEAPQTPEKTSTDIEEPESIDTSKKSSKKSKKSNKATKTAAAEETVEAPQTPEKTSTDIEEPESIGTSKKSSKKSKAKNPNAPKKPVHYNIPFKNAIRSKVVEENPGLSTGEINKVLAKRYKEATDEELQPFKAVHDEATKKYKKEVEEYEKKKNGGKDDENDVEEIENDVEEVSKEKNGTKTTKKEKKKKKKKEKSKIKKNVSAYMHFSIAKGPELKEKGIKPPQSGKVLGKLWKELPKSERAEFEEIAKNDKERYLKEVEDAKAAEDVKTYLKNNWNSVPDAVV